jgi:hypothetical protein
MKVGDTEGALKAATEAKAASTKSPTGLQASSILTELTYTGVERGKRLAALERKARSERWLTLADNIAIRLADDSESPAEKLRHLDRVTLNKIRGYNESRAIVAKAEASHMVDSPRLLTDVELFALAGAYSYLHSQRYESLFNRCHRELWQVLESRGNDAQLLRLFRHSSFLWRIRGDSGHEEEYLRRLEARNLASSSGAANRGIVVEVYYFLRRLKAVLAGALSGMPVGEAHKATA